MNLIPLQLFQLLLDFVKRAKQNEISRKVKIADLRHNMDLTRMNEITEFDIKRYQKYEKALKFNSDETVNQYLQQIYSNLTTLYDETEQIMLAKKYCKKALELNTKKGDTEGLFNTNIKLAELYSDENTDESKNYILNAIKYANKLSDKFYKLSALMLYGDYLYSKSEVLEALEQYFEANKLAKDNFMDEYYGKINQRILDVNHGERQIPLKFQHLHHLCCLDR